MHRPILAHGRLTVPGHIMTEHLERRELMSVVFQDDFEGYGDDAAFGAVWRPDGAPAYAFDPAFGRDSAKSVKLVDPGGGTGTSDRYAVEFPSPLVATDAAPVVFAIDLYLDPSGEATSWRDAFHVADLRGYEPGPVPPGNVTGVVALGVATASADFWSPDYFQGRVLRFPAFGGSNLYYTLDATPGAGPTPAVAATPGRRSSGWHHLAAEVRPPRTDFYVDGRLAETAPGIDRPFTRVVIGSGLGAGGHTMWLDNPVVRRRDGEPPAARLADANRRGNFVRHTLNRRGYIDVTFPAPAGGGSSAGGRAIDPRSVLDGPAEFAVTGEAAAGVTLAPGTPVRIDASTFRYRFTGRFAPGAFGVEYLHDAWSDAGGNSNAQAAEAHRVVRRSTPPPPRALQLRIFRRSVGL